MENQFLFDRLDRLEDKITFSIKEVESSVKELSIDYQDFKIQTREDVARLSAKQAFLWGGIAFVVNLSITVALAVWTK